MIKIKNPPDIAQKEKRKPFGIGGFRPRPVDSYTVTTQIVRVPEPGNTITLIRENKDKVNLSCLATSVARTLLVNYLPLNLVMEKDP